MAKVFNGGHEPLVLTWGDGVIPPGEGVETDVPESFGSPWTASADEAAAAGRAWAEQQSAQDEAASGVEGRQKPRKEAKKDGAAPAAVQSPADAPANPQEG